MKNRKWEQHEATCARHHDFVQVQNTCPLCNSQLTIRVESYLEDFTLREEATCPKCQILARVKDHKMH
jgi:RNA polymerase subunit RPABC4/transcription elongation factor Spt4